MRIRIDTALVAILLACICSRTALAANWEWGSDLSVAANWNDNPALADDSRDPAATFRVVAAYNGQIERLSSGSSWVFSPRVTRDFYPDKEFKDLESTDLFLPGSYRKLGSRTNLGLAFNLSRQNVLSDEQTISDTGANQLNADDIVYRASLSPSFSWVVTEKDQVSFALTANITDYDLEFSNRADSKAAGINGSYSRTLTQRQSLGFSASANKFASDNKRLFALGIPPALVPVEINNESSQESLTLDYGFSINATSKLGVSYGFQSSSTDNEITELATGLPIPIGSTTEFKSSTYNISYKKTTERGEFNVVASRRIVPSTNGQPQDRYDIGFRGKTQLSKKLNGEWNLSAFEQQNIVLSATDGELNRKTRYYNADFRLIWAFDRKWRINGTYRIRHRDRDSVINSEDSITATSNHVLVGITYRWKTIQK